VSKTAQKINKNVMGICVFHANTKELAFKAKAKNLIFKANDITCQPWRTWRPRRWPRLWGQDHGLASSSRPRPRLRGQDHGLKDCRSEWPHVAVAL